MSSVFRHSDSIVESFFFLIVDLEPAKSSLAHFLWPDSSSASLYHPRLLLGNGASELIDVCQLVVSGISPHYHVARGARQSRWPMGTWSYVGSV
jgi:hypothetical protein